MSLQTLSSILYSRYGFRLAGDACYEHKLPDKVLQLFGTSAAYLFESCPAAGSSSSSASNITPQGESTDGMDLVDDDEFCLSTPME